MTATTEVTTDASIWVSVHELHEQTERILRRVFEQGHIIAIVDHGRIVARLTPAQQQSVDPAELEAFWAEWDRLAAEIGAKWPKGLSAAEAIKQDRREP